MEIELSDIRYIIERMLWRHALLDDGRSALGPQLELLRMADPKVKGAPRAAEKAGSLWARADRAHSKHDEFAYYCQLAKLLTPDEYGVLEAMHRPATPEELVNRMPPETNERIRAVWRGDVIYEVVHGQPAHYRTRSGGEVVHDCQGDPACMRQDCPHDEQRVLVREIVPKWPTTVEVALRCALTPAQVRRRIKSAYQAIRGSIESRTINQARRLLAVGE